MFSGNRLIGRLKWYFLRPFQKLTRGWAYSDFWGLDYHFAKYILPRLRSFSAAYRAGQFDSLCPGRVLLEYKDEMVLEGFVWNDDGYFEGEDAEWRLREIWQGILDSMVRSFQWIVEGEPIPDSCYYPNPSFEPTAKPLLCYSGGRSTINPAYGEKSLDSDKYRDFQREMDTGLELFGRYFRHLND